MKRFAGLLSVIVLPLAGPSWLSPAALWGQQETDRHPTLEDLFTVKSIGGVEVSPDGEAVLYTVTESILEENETNVDIWLIRKEGREWSGPVRMTTSDEDDTRPRWRPDGNAFAFLSARDGDEQGSEDRSGGGDRRKLYLMNALGGEPEELYAHETGIAAFEWSFDGRAIAFTARDEESDVAKDRKDKGRDITIEDEPVRYTHLWVLDVETREARRLTEGHEFTVGSFDWNPTGRTLAFSATPTNLPTDSWRSDIYLVSTDPADLGLRKITDNPGPDASPVWTPDGTHIVYQGDQTGEYRVGYSRVFRIPAGGGEPEDISPKLDVQPGSYSFTEDGTAVLFEATTGTTRGLFYMTLATREPVRLTPDAGVYQAPGFSRDLKQVAFVFQDPTHPQEVYTSSLGSQPGEGSVRAEGALTEHNEHAAPWAVGRTDVLRWKGTDGSDVEGLVVYPAGWTVGAGPRPLIVKIHGGPSGVYTQTFQAASSSADAQRYAADGYAVLLPNPRGSSGYGERSIQSVVTDWGGLDYQDIMAGVDTLVAQRVAHPDSLGVMGWSYGGYMTAWTVTQTTRFKAAVAGAAITETIAMWGTHDILHVFEGYFGGSPYEAGRWEAYQKSNPLAFISRARTPTLMIHGENDPRVPPNQARIFFRALRANGVPAKLVWLPRTGHGPREPGLRYETAKHQKEWMDRWIRGRTGMPATSEGTHPAP
jgi:dipeptidyl aminopeptidase/acylaminoacyl peptidase